SRSRALRSSSPRPRGEQHAARSPAEGSRPAPTRKAARPGPPRREAEIRPLGPHGGHTGPVRIYLPATFAELDAHPAPLAIGSAHGATAIVRAALPTEDEESWEFVAQLAAADESLARLTGEDVPLRLVIVADVPEAVVREVDGAA